MNISEINSLYNISGISSFADVQSTAPAPVFGGKNIDVDTIVERMDFENGKARDASRHSLFLNALNKISKLYENAQSGQAGILNDIADLEEKNAGLKEELHELSNELKLLELEYSSLKTIIDNMKPDDEEIESKKKRLEELARKKTELKQKIADEESIALDNANTVLYLVGKLSSPALKALVETAMLTLGDVNRMAWSNPKFDKNIYKEGVQPVVDALEATQKKIRDEQLDEVMEEVSKQSYV